MQPQDTPSRQHPQQAGEGGFCGKCGTLVKLDDLAKLSLVQINGIWLYRVQTYPHCSEF